MKFFHNYDRFELEQDILRVWGVTDLIEEFLRQHMDSPTPFTEDELFNKLNGIKEVLDMSSQRLWNGFELMVTSRHFKTQEEIQNER
jgi:hypothetical protein